MAHLYEEVRIRMRDGVRLAGALFRPVEGNAPTLCVRTPYGLEHPIGGSAGTYPNFLGLLDAGYAILWVECRGTFGSEGDFRPNVNEVQDGYDTLEWIVGQPWSNGAVGGYGMSYFGMTQWAAAVSGHPALKAIVPVMTGMDFYKGAWFGPGSALSVMTTTAWFAAASMNELVRRPPDSVSSQSSSIRDIVAGLTTGTELVDHTPIADHPLIAPGTIAHESYQQVLNHPSYDDYWMAQDLSTAAGDIKSPALVVAGWYDYFLGQSLRDFQLVRKGAGTVQAREESRLIIGPWDHSDPNMEALFPARDFGIGASGSAANMHREHLTHFARHLPTTNNRIDPEEPLASRVRLFVMGIDEWRDEAEWPLPDTNYLEFYLDDGCLSSRNPTQDREYKYQYDPADPVRTTESARPAVVFQPNDQRQKGQRADVLTFMTPELDEPFEVTGHVRAVLWVSSSAPDTDFTAMLIDVSPDGRAVNLCDGIVRMRYRDGGPGSALLRPADVYEVNVDLAATSNVFLPGHRVRVDISSSNFPRYDRNMNTGVPVAKERLEHSQVATNSVLTGPARPSRVVLPVIRR